MNDYRIIYSTVEGNAQETVTERSEVAARKFFKARHRDAEITSIEIVNVDATATKAQERETLEKIKAMVEELGPNSYLKTAFTGVYEVAEENIDMDAAFSLKGRAELAEGQVKDLRNEIEDLEDQINEGKRQIALLERELANENAKAQSTNAGIEELFREMEKHKTALSQMGKALDEARSATGDAQRRAEEAEAQVVQLKAKLYDYMTA